MQQKWWSSTIEGLDELLSNNSEVGHLLNLGRGYQTSNSQEKDDQLPNSFFQDEFEQFQADRFLQISYHQESQIFMNVNEDNTFETPLESASEQHEPQNEDIFKTNENYETDKYQSTTPDIEEQVQFKNHIFVEHDPLKSQRKNTNVLKFFIKGFFREFQNCVDFDDPEWKNFNENKRMEIFMDPRKIKLNALSQVFGANSKDRNEFQKKNRQFMKKLVKSEGFKEKNIFRSSYIKSMANRKQYLLACKVFSLRCRSAALTSRLESR